MKVGFIGVGQMGVHMARHVAEAGFELVVNDARREAAAPLVERRRPLGGHAGGGGRGLPRGHHLPSLPGQRGGGRPGAAGPRPELAGRATSTST